MSKKLDRLYKIIERHKKEKDSRMDQVSDGCKRMLRKILNQKRIGGRHMPERLVFKSIQYLPKQEYKDAIKDWEDCIKEGLIMTKQKPNERHVSLNPRRFNEAALLAGEK